MGSPTDEIYERAATALGKTPSQLRAIGEGVFASMLAHALNAPGRPIWTLAGVVDAADGGQRLDVEVDVRPRRPTDAR